MDQSLVSVMRNINDALRLDDDSHHKEAYMKYLDCVLCITCNLQQGVRAMGGDVVVTKQVTKQVKLAQQCVERVAVLVEEIASAQKPITLTSPQEEMGPGYHSLSQPSLTSVSVSRTKPYMVVPPLPPESTANTFARARVTTPMELASKQNQQLMTAYKARLKRMNKRDPVAFNLSLTVQRKMAENLAIAKRTEMALAKKMQERQARLEEQAAKRFATPIGMSEEEQEQRQVYKKILEYEQDAKWLQDWRTKLSTSPKEPELICQLIQEILRCRDHPLTVLLRQYQYKVYEKLYPIVANKRQRLEAITVPLNPDLWPPDLCTTPGGNHSHSIGADSNKQKKERRKEEEDEGIQRDKDQSSRSSSVEETSQLSHYQENRKRDDSVTEQALDKGRGESSSSTSSLQSSAGVKMEASDNSGVVVGVSGDSERDVNKVYNGSGSDKDSGSGNNTESVCGSSNNMESVCGNDMGVDSNIDRVSGSDDNMNANCGGNNSDPPSNNTKPTVNDYSQDGAENVSATDCSNSEEDHASTEDTPPEKLEDEKNENSATNAVAHSEVNSKEDTGRATRKDATEDTSRATREDATEDAGRALTEDTTEDTGRAATEDSSSIAQAVEDCKEDVERAISRGDHLQSQLITQQERAANILRQISEDYESYNAENMDDLFDDDDDDEKKEEGGEEKKNVSQDSTDTLQSSLHQHTFSDTQSHQDHSNNAPELRTSQSVSSQSSCGGDADSGRGSLSYGQGLPVGQGQDFPSLPSLSSLHDLPSPQDMLPSLPGQEFPRSLEDQQELQRLSQEAYQRHVKNISADVHQYMEKLLLLFAIAYEQLDCPQGRDQCYASLEEAFFKPLWKFILMLFRLAHYQEEINVAYKMTQNQDQGPRDMGVSHKLCLTSDPDLDRDPSRSPAGGKKDEGSRSLSAGGGGGVGGGGGGDAQPYARAISHLQCLQNHYTMLSKLECVVKVVHLIFDSIKDHYINQGCAPSEVPNVGADDLLPVMSYVVMQSRLPQLVSEVHAMAEFIHEGYMMGQEGYCLTTLETAVSFIAMSDLKTPISPS